VTTAQGAEQQSQAETDLDLILRSGKTLSDGANAFIKERAKDGCSWDEIQQRLAAAIHFNAQVSTHSTRYSDWAACERFAEEEVSFVRTNGRIHGRDGDDDQAQLVGPRAPDLAEFLTIEFPPRENIVSPVFPRQGLGMVHAWRGLGKTYFALFFAYTVATGGQFLKWSVARAWRVLYVDGEMRGVDIQERLSEIVRASDGPPLPGAFRIITPDLQPNGIPDLGTPEGQAWLDSVIEDRDFIVLDNLSSLLRTPDSEDEPWLPMLDWLLSIRRRGKSALIIHHDGKNETQRGLSRHEDQLDTVFHLQKPKDYREQDGARFVIRFPKHRGFYGKDAEPFEVALITNDDGVLEWTVTDLEDATTIQVADLLTAGCTVSQIKAELGIGRATVDRHKKKAIARGLYNGK
jgi:putative DNA primase/helicase